MTDSIPKHLVYWAPELIHRDRFNHKVDIWALGVSLYQLITGEHPFNTLDEDSFREDVVTANYDHSRLVTSSRLRAVI